RTPAAAVSIVAGRRPRLPQALRCAHGGVARRRLVRARPCRAGTDPRHAHARARAPVGAAARRQTAARTSRGIAWRVRRRGPVHGGPGSRGRLPTRRAQLPIPQRRPGTPCLVQRHGLAALPPARRLRRPRAALPERGRPLLLPRDRRPPSPRRRTDVPTREPYLAPASRADLAPASRADLAP